MNNGELLCQNKEKVIEKRKNRNRELKEPRSLKKIQKGMIPWINSLKNTLVEVS